MKTAAKDFLWDRTWGRDVSSSEIEVIMIEFAKKHVEAALEQASINCTIGTRDACGDFIASSIKKQVIQAYPLTNIK